MKDGSPLPEHYGGPISPIQILGDKKYAVWGEATYLTWFAQTHNWPPNTVLDQRMGDLDRISDSTMDAQRNRG